MTRTLACVLLMTPFVITSCFAPKKSAQKEPSPFGPSGVPPQLAGKKSEEGTPIIPGGNQPTVLAPKNITPEEDILFTDPDNPDAGVPELSAILEAPKSKSWEESEAKAKQRAMREGKPILIWFTDSLRNPMSGALSQELFSTPDFEKWADEKLIRLRVDSNIKITDGSLDMDSRTHRETELKDYVDGLKKRYNIMGAPVVLVLKPSGEVIGRYRGYKRGGAAFLWGQIKHSQDVAARAYQSWRSSLEAKGYREWQDRKGRKVFAKLKSYAKNGDMVLIEPDGTRSRTKEYLLSEKDSDWLDEQKKMRGIQ